MFTYLEDDKILFSCDAFGNHFCDERMYDDKVGDFSDSFKYYFDVILKSFSKYMLKAIEKIRPLEISAICTGHGPILRTNWKKWVDISEKYAQEALDFPDIYDGLRGMQFIDKVVESSGSDSWVNI